MPCCGLEPGTQSSTNNDPLRGSGPCSAIRSRPESRPSRTWCWSSQGTLRWCRGLSHEAVGRTRKSSEAQIYLSLRIAIEHGRGSNSHIGTFVCSTNIHVAQVLCHHAPRTASIVVGLGSKDVVFGTSSTQARAASRCVVLCCAVCSALHCSCHVMTHGTAHTWHTGSLALGKKISLRASQPAGSCGRLKPSIVSSIGSQAKMVPCLGRHAPPSCLLPDRLGRSHRARDGDGSAWWILGSQEVFRCPS